MTRRAHSRIQVADEQRVDDDVLAGLRAAHKHLPCRLLYDARGAELFEQICAVADYYPARTEIALLEHHLPAIAAAVGARARVIEPGSGAGRKTRLLLAALAQPAIYVPIDISSEQLETTARALRDAFPALEVTPVHGDYTRAIALPHPRTSFERTLIFFPGSTIGNFEPVEAEAFLARLAVLAGPHSMLLLGADSNADPESLLHAYDDAQGITAAFDLNILEHVNRTHHATFEPDAFMHRARWNARRSRVEMHLVSRRRQTVRVADEVFELDPGESIVTEHCYKHSEDTLRALLADAGWAVHQVFVDQQRRMHLWLAVRR
jgi:dimethylhistidine N-methyltransferase